MRSWPNGGPLVPPETPPILNAEGRRTSLVNDNANRDSKTTEEKSEHELMIGEIRVSFGSVRFGSVRFGSVRFAWGWGFGWVSGQGRCAD